MGDPLYFISISYKMFLFLFLWCVHVEARGQVSGVSSLPLSLLQGFCRLNSSLQARGAVLLALISVSYRTLEKGLFKSAWFPYQPLPLDKSFLKHVRDRNRSLSFMSKEQTASGCSLSSPLAVGETLVCPLATASPRLPYATQNSSWLILPLAHGDQNVWSLHWVSLASQMLPTTRQLHEYELTSTEKLDTQMLGQPFGRRWIAGIAMSVYCFMGGLALLFIYPARSRHCSHDEQRSSRISFGEKDPSLKARY